MAKSFLVDTGYEVLYGYVWYGPGVQLVVEEGDQILLYVTPRNKRGACVGKYRYNQLDVDAPPQGLRKMSVADKRGALPRES